MKDRCLNENSDAYFRYGGRGIKICQRWADSFEAFLEDMGPRPSLQHSIDRFPDNNGNYEPGNCRWATSKQQQRNRNITTLLSFRGESKPLTEWADLIGIRCSVIEKRLRIGWSVEKALTAPIDQKRGRKLGSAVLFNGQTKSLADWAASLGGSKNLIFQRLRYGWSMERALSTPVRKGELS